LLLHHDALRLHFAHEGSGWQQFMAGGDVAVSLDRVDVSVLSYPEQRSTIEVTATELQASLNLAEAPLMRATFFDLGTDRPSRLLIIIHHLAVDSVSWRVLLEDLEAIYRRLSRGETISLPPKTTSYKQWSETLTEYARSVDVRRGLDYWLAAPRSEIERVGIPVDNADSNANTRSSARTLAVSLDVEETQVLLQEVPAVYNTQINDVLLTALVQSFSQWTGVGSLMVGLEGHGREAIVEGIDLSRTVGWFTSFFPVTLDLGEVSNTGDALKRIKEQLRRVPDRGIGYGVLRYLSGDGGIIGKLASLPQPEVLFNYGGQLDQILPGSSLFRLARESIGPAQSLQGKRSHLLEINALVVEDRLQLNWAYSEKVHRRATIEKLAENFVKSLRSLIAHCLSPEAGGYTPSDFPDADLNQEVLDDLIADLDESIE
jgi:non-ribosomal peptide synthase protein (TIGR01720 family)